MHVFFSHLLFFSAFLYFVCKSINWSSVLICIPPDFRHANLYSISIPNVWVQEGVSWRCRASCRRRRSARRCCSRFTFLLSNALRVFQHSPTVATSSGRVPLHSASLRGHTRSSCTPSCYFYWYHSSPSSLSHSPTPPPPYGVSFIVINPGEPERCARARSVKCIGSLGPLIYNISDIDIRHKMFYIKYNVSQNKNS